MSQEKGSAHCTERVGCLRETLIRLRKIFLLISQNLVRVKSTQKRVPMQKKGGQARPLPWQGSASWATHAFDFGKSHSLSLKSKLLNVPTIGDEQNLLVWLNIGIFLLSGLMEVNHTHIGKLKGGLEEHLVQPFHVTAVETEAQWGV